MELVRFRLVRTTTSVVVEVHPDDNDVILNGQCASKKFHLKDGYDFVREVAPGATIDDLGYWMRISGDIDVPIYPSTCEHDCWSCVEVNFHQLEIIPNWICLEASNCWPVNELRSSVAMREVKHAR